MLTRRDFVRSTTASLAAAATVPAALDAAPARSAELLIQRTVKPVVIADYSGIEFTNGGKENAVERAFRLITEGSDVLDALIAGVNIPELDPLETGIGYGALPQRRRHHRTRCLVHARSAEAGRRRRSVCTACARRRSWPGR